MYVIGLLDALPRWGVFLVSLVVIVVSAELGFRYGQRLNRRLRRARRPGIGTLVGATMGMLAFMLAFTFGSTNSRFDVRKDLVLKEANAIGTAFMRAGILAPAERERAEGLLRKYLADRVEFMQHFDMHLLPAVGARAEQIQAELWSQAMRVADRQPTPLVALYVAALNDVIDVHGERIALGKYYRLPTFFWSALLCLVVITMGLGGYSAGRSGERRDISMPATAAAFSVVITLIVELDNPSSAGLSVVNQGPLVDLQRSIDGRAG